MQELLDLQLANDKLLENNNKHLKLEDIVLNNAFSLNKVLSNNRFYIARKTPKKLNISIFINNRCKYNLFLNVYIVLSI